MKNIFPAFFISKIPKSGQSFPVNPAKMTGKSRFSLIWMQRITLTGNGKNSDSGSPSLSTEKGASISIYKNICKAVSANFNFFHR